MPDTLELGPLAGPGAAAAYCPAFLPYVWRGWVPFGNGTVGDWAATWSTRSSGPWTSASPKTIVSERQGLRPQDPGRGLSQGRENHLRVPGQGRPRPDHHALVQRHGAHSAARRSGAGPQPGRHRRGGAGRQGYDHVRLARGGRRADHPREQDASLQAADPKASPGPRSTTRTGCRLSARARRPGPISPTAARSRKSPCWA